MKINKHLLTVLFSIILLNCFSQQITFNKLYNPISTSTSGAGAIITKGNGYVVQAIVWDNSGGLEFLELDSIGNLIKIIQFNHDTTWYYDGYG